MRKIFTITFLITSLIALGQSSRPTSQPSKTNTIIVLNGVPVPINTLDYLNPDDIESIDLLKGDPNCKDHMCDSRDIVVITTKSSKLRKFIIKDFLEGKTVPGATVKFKSKKDKNDSLVIAANDSGFVLNNKLKPGAEYNIEVSAVGFKTYSLHFRNSSLYKEETIFLEKDIKLLKEVVVTNTTCLRKRSRICCGGHLVSTCEFLKTRDSIKQKPSFKIYPNLVNSGASINLKLPANLSVNFIVRIFSLSGAAVFQQKFSGVKTNTINLLLNSRLSASEYIVQLVDENGKAAGQQKIIVQ